MPECAASIFSKIDTWKISINDVETFVRTNKKKTDDLYLPWI